MPECARSEAGRANISISGGMTKISGMTAIAETMEPLRRYSRSSLWNMARTRLVLTLISGSLEEGAMATPDGRSTGAPRSAVTV